MKKVEKTLAPRQLTVGRKELAQGNAHKNKKAYKRKEKHSDRDHSVTFYNNIN